jgi:hypothetical protein
MQAKQSSQNLDRMTLKCNSVRRKKYIRDLMPETGTGLQIALNSSKASYYE